MKITSLVVNITDITDDLVLGKNDDVTEIIKIGKSIIEKGGKVTIQRNYTNAPPDILVEYETVEDLKNWKNKLNDVQKALGRDPIK